MRIYLCIAGKILVRKTKKIPCMGMLQIPTKNKYYLNKAMEIDILRIKVILYIITKFLKRVVSISFEIFPFDTVNKQPIKIQIIWTISDELVFLIMSLWNAVLLYG